MIILGADSKRACATKSCATLAKGNTQATREETRSRRRHAGGARGFTTAVLGMVDWDNDRYAPHDAESAISGVG